MKPKKIYCVGKCAAITKLLREIGQQLTTPTIIHSPATLPAPGVGKPL